MKKIYTAIFAALITISIFCACGNNDTDISEDKISGTAMPTSSPESNDRISFDIENKTGTNFEKIYISEGSMEQWEDSLLPSDGKFEDGNTISVSVIDDETVDDWDIKAEDENGDFIYWQSLDLKNAKKIILKISDDKPLAEIE